MADLYLLGKVSKEEHPYFDDDYWFYISRVENGEEDCVAFNKGTNMLGDVMFLWDLISSENRKKYYEFLKNEIEVESNHLDSGGYLITVEQVKHILEMIDNLDEKLEKFLDADGRVLPQYIRLIQQIYPSQTFDDGELDRDALRGEISKVRMMKRFLQEAIKLNYPLAID